MSIKESFKAEVNKAYVKGNNDVVTIHYGGEELLLWEEEARALLSSLERILERMALVREEEARKPKVINMSGVNVEVGVVEGFGSTHGTLRVAQDGEKPWYGSAEEFRQIAEAMWDAADRVDGSSK